MEEIKKRIAMKRIFHKEEEHQIIVAGVEKIIKTKEFVIMENWAHTTKYARLIITIQMIVGFNAKNAHGTLII